MGDKPICLPFASEALYREYVDHPAQYRQYLSEMLHQYPELFPQNMDQGFPFHDAYASVKQDVIVRRMKLQATGAVFSLRPSCVMPSMIGRTDAVEKALYLRQWGVPFDSLAYVFGRDAMCWYRAWLACGRPSLVGTTVKDPHKGAPRSGGRCAADPGRQATGLCPDHRGRRLFPGGERGRGRRYGDRGAGLGRVCQGSQGPGPAYQARSVCTDGWEATRQAWRGCFPRSLGCGVFSTRSGR